MERTLGVVLAGTVALAGAGHAQTFDTDYGAGDTADVTEPSPGPNYGFTLTDTDYGFFSHGYYRLGVGTTDGSDFVAFKLDGAASKYRLGNESDIYAEASLGYRGKVGSNSDFIAEVMFNGWGNSNALNFGAPVDSGSGVAQAYAGIERLGSGPLAESFMWAGRRYYRRRDVHITDFYYENYSNDGLGLENADFGRFHLSTALFYSDKDDDGLDYQAGTLDVRFHDIALGGGWMGELGLSYTDSRGNDAPDNDGFTIRLHADNVELSWGEWRTALMYGRGAGINFDSNGDPNVASDDDRWRFVTQAMILTSDSFQTQATAVWERTDIGGEAQTWISVGARPQYNITDNFGVAVEAGYDQVTPENGDTGRLTKLTLAPFYSFGKRGFWARPQLRAFVTWADWNEEGVITDQAALGNVTSGTTYGVQLEHWW